MDKLIVYSYTKGSGKWKTQDSNTIAVFYNEWDDVFRCSEMREDGHTLTEPMPTWLQFIWYNDVE